jgi:hypothetical protein
VAETKHYEVILKSKDRLVIAADTFEYTPVFIMFIVADQRVAIFSVAELVGFYDRTVEASEGSHGQPGIHA